MIVVDASALLEVLLRTGTGLTAEARLLESGETLHAPHLLDLEIAQVLRRFADTGRMASDRCRAALTDLIDFPIRRYAHDFLLPRIWELRKNLSAYDASYIALAELLDARLLTCDRRLITAPGHTARVELV